MTIELSQAAYDELKQKLGLDNLLNMDGVSITRSLSPSQILNGYVTKKKLPPNIEWLAIECAVDAEKFVATQEVIVTVTPKE